MGACFTHIKFALRYLYRYLKVKVEVQQLELGIIRKLMKWCKQLLSTVKAGSVFFGRICTSVVNLALALRTPLRLSNLNSITSPIIVEAVDVIPCLLHCSCEVDCVTYQCEPCCRHS